MSVPFVLAWAFAALLMLAPAEPRFVAEGLDPVALESGLRLRVGPILDAWGIAVRATDLRGTYELELLAPGSSEPNVRVVSLVGETDEDRSRELAVMLALILAESPAPVLPPTPTPVPVLPRTPVLPRMVVALESHVGLGPIRQPDLDLGLGLGAGVWVVRDHLQPRVRAGWSHSSGESLRVDGLHVGAGLASGVPLGSWWLGVLVLPSFKWTRGVDRKPSIALSGGGELTAVVQYRRPRLVVGLRTGVETTFRPVLVRGSNDVIRWGPVRWTLVLELGLGLGR